MDENALAWLLESNNPAVRYRTLTELLDRPHTDATVIEERDSARSMPEIEELFQRRSEDGYWYFIDSHTRQEIKDPLHEKNIYYMSAVLQYCAEFGLDASDERPTKAIHRFLTEIDDIKNEKLREPCKYTQFIRSLVMMGYRDHPGVQRLIDHLQKSIRWDNGYLCDRMERKRKTRPVKSCVLGTQPALLAFSSLPELWDTDQYKRLIEYFLRRDLLYRTDRPDELVHRHIDRAQFPFGFGGLLGILFSLSKMGYGSRRELRAAWNVLEGKRLPNGRYIVDTKSPYATDPRNRLPFLGKRHGESKWVTFYALVARKDAGLRP